VTYWTGVRFPDRICQVFWDLTMGGRVTERGTALLAYREELSPQQVRKIVRCLFH
jgi:hypothetical protein